jgi:hypothetical protein
MVLFPTCAADAFICWCVDECIAKTCVNFLWLQSISKQQSELFVLLKKVYTHEMTPILSVNLGICGWNVSEVSWLRRNKFLFYRVLGGINTA